MKWSTPPPWIHDHFLGLPHFQHLTERGKRQKFLSTQEQKVAKEIDGGNQQTSNMTHS